MKTKTNILDKFTTIKEFDFGPMKCINTSEIRDALKVNVVDCIASGHTTIRKGNFEQGMFSDAETFDLLEFALGGTFGASVLLNGNEFVVTAWND